MKYLGIDYGTKRVGIAISDAAGSIAFPLEVVERKKALERITELSREKKVEVLVIGDTRSHGGGENTVTAESDAFANELGEQTGIPVSRTFEAWSSIEASRYAPPGNEHEDAAAAAIILQRFLDMHQKS